MNSLEKLLAALGYDRSSVDYLNNIQKGNSSQNLAAVAQQQMQLPQVQMDQLFMPTPNPKSREIEFLLQQPTVANPQVSEQSAQLKTNEKPDVMQSPIPYPTYSEAMAKKERESTEKESKGIDASLAKAAELDARLPPSQRTGVADAIGFYPLPGSEKLFNEEDWNRAMQYKEQIQKYFPADSWNQAMNIMAVESKGNAQAVGDNYPIKGEVRPSYGLYQVRTFPDRPTPEKLVDPEVNIQFAGDLYKSQGWDPWLNSRKKLGI
jgi:hypothetical protein